MSKYVKKKRIIDAILLANDDTSISTAVALVFAEDKSRDQQAICDQVKTTGHLAVQTYNGTVEVQYGQYIAKNTDGSYFVSDVDPFNETYEGVVV